MKKLFSKKKKSQSASEKIESKPKTLKEETMPAETNKAPTDSSQQAHPSVRYIDRPECNETFADSVNTLSFDGQSLRIEFGVTRLDERLQNAPLTGRRYPACRLVLTPVAGVDLINKMQQIGAALAQSGIVRVAPGSAAGREQTKDAAG